MLVWSPPPLSVRERERRRGGADGCQTPVLTSHRAEVIRHKVVVCHLAKAKKDTFISSKHLYIHLFTHTRP